MKKTLKLFIPILLLIPIYLIFTAYKTNYDVRYLTPKTETVVITAKNIKPAGTTPRTVVIGKTISQSPVTNQEEPTLFFMLENKENGIVVDENTYKNSTVGDTISITFFEPKYYGNPFGFHIK